MEKKHLSIEDLLQMSRGVYQQLKDEVYGSNLKLKPIEFTKPPNLTKQVASSLFEQKSTLFEDTDGETRLVIIYEASNFT